MRNIPREWMAGGVATLLAIVLILTASGPDQSGVKVSARGQ